MTHIPKYYIERREKIKEKLRFLGDSREIERKKRLDLENQLQIIEEVIYNRQNAEKAEFEVER